MLEQTITRSGGVVYFSPLLTRIGVKHAFSTRIGGVSCGPFASLNLGNPAGCALQDDLANIQENHRRIMQSTGMADRRICRVKQVHGSRAVRVDTNEQADLPTEADAMVTCNTEFVLAVRVADCVPILLASEAGRQVAAVHAGWRGVVAGVLPAALAELRAMDPSAPVAAAIGPCIGFDAFEVGPEVLDEFVRLFGDDAPACPAPHGKARVDLRQAVRLQLLKAGIGPDHIDTTDRCTCRDAAEFFSHRRERGSTGRMAALICPKG